MIVSGFGWRRDPWTRRRVFHKGVDLRGELGAPVRAFLAGTVQSVTRHPAAGLTVTIQTSGVTRHVYAHLHTATVRRGQRIVTGQVIGTVGSSGRSTGPHLHFGVHQNGAWLNPTLFVQQHAHLHP